MLDNCTTILSIRGNRDEYESIWKEIKGVGKTAIDIILISLTYLYGCIKRTVIVLFCVHVLFLYFLYCSY